MFGGLLGGVVVVFVVGLVILVIGFDIVGLIRILVVCCGVVGYKLLCGWNFVDVLFNLDFYCYMGLMVCIVVDVLLF